MESNQESICPICLTVITDLAMTDSCRHEFCFNCIHLWSNYQDRCPLCRSNYSNLMYNLTNDGQFLLLPVEQRQSNMTNERILSMIQIGMTIVVLFWKKKNLIELIKRINDLINSLNSENNLEERQHLVEMNDKLREIVLQIDELMQDCITIQNHVIYNQIEQEQAIQTSDIIRSRLIAFIHEIIRLVNAHQVQYQNDVPSETIHWLHQWNSQLQQMIHSIESIHFDQFNFDGFNFDQSDQETSSSDDENESENVSMNSDDENNDDNNMSDVNEKNSNSSGHSNTSDPNDHSNTSDPNDQLDFELD